MIMENDEVQQLLDELGVPGHHPDFLDKVFTHYCKKYPHEYPFLSKLAERSDIQESCSIRNVLKTRHIATQLITDNGDIDFDKLKKWIEYFEKNLFPMGKRRQYDRRRNIHILNVLRLLESKKNLQRLLRQISKPISNRFGDDVLIDTLMLPSKTVVTDAIARRAALSAWLCYLRQNVGSCFATAPAIMIHDEQPYQMLKDMIDLLATGYLKRTFEGIEYTAPISASWGAGDLRKGILIIDEAHPVWESPGLIFAWIAAEMIKEDEEWHDKIQLSKKIIEKALPEIPSDSIFAENMIKTALRQHVGVTVEELQEYELQNSAQHSLLKYAGSPGKKGRLCARYWQLYQQAIRAFRGITDNALLKTWEFTIASFTETKSNFTQWNMYTSLGMQAHEPGGIGEQLKIILEEKFQYWKRQADEYRIEHESVHLQLKALESRFRNVSNERDVQWLKMDYQAKSNEFQTIEELYQNAINRADFYANMFGFLMEQYISFFPRHFQEVYDADMRESVSSLYDDSPAGFRLLYKHGRTFSGQWTRIDSLESYSDALAGFFTATEYDLMNLLELDGFQRDVSEIVTSLVGHVKTPLFLESALQRMVIAHGGSPIKDPMENLDKLPKKPWAYTSGGSMENLVISYFRREQKPSMISRWMENPMELFGFLVDTMKQMPSQTEDLFLKSSSRSLLMQSPTHAFLFKPGWKPFVDSWQTDAFTYTWLRDHFVLPSQHFLEWIKLDQDMIQFLLDKLAEKIPVTYRHYFSRALQMGYWKHMGPVDFRAQLEMIFDSDPSFRFLPGIGALVNLVDNLLFSSLPLFRGYELMDKATAIVNEIQEIREKRKQNIIEIVRKIADTIPGREILTTDQLQNILLAAFCIERKGPLIRIDVHRIIKEAAEKLGFALPSPVSFADTNWVKDDFAMVVNPGTGQPELWCVDSLAKEGFSMAVWREWLNGSRRQPTWGIYNQPYEYQAPEEI